MIGIYLTAYYPELVKKLVLIGSAGLKSNRHKLGTIIGDVRRLLAKLGLTKLENLGRRIVYRGLDVSDYHLSGAMKPIFRNVIAQDLSMAMQQVSCSTLIIHGEKDIIVPVAAGQRMQRFIRNSRLEIIKNAGHFAHLEKPELVFGLIGKFVKE